MWVSELLFGFQEVSEISSMAFSCSSSKKKKKKKKRKKMSSPKMLERKH